MPNELTDEQAQRIGERLADVLNLRADRSFTPPRFHTDWGTFTAQGLARVALRIITEGA